MELKRIRGADGRATHVRVNHTGRAAEQVWSARCVQEWVEEGWMSLDGDRILIATAPDQDDLHYRIVRRPGYYCAATGERIPLSDLAMSQFMGKSLATLAPREAAAWLVARGRAATAYVPTRNYHCELDASQHAKYRKGA